MKNRINILNKHLLRSIMMILMMGWMGNAWAQSTFITQSLYSTNFDEWDKKDAKAEGVIILKKTTDGQDLEFHLINTKSVPDGTNNKFSNECITKGYLQLADNGTTYVETSSLKSITKVKYVHASTGKDRGIKLEIKGDGDNDWKVISDAACPQAGQIVEIDIESISGARTNAKLRFSNVSSTKAGYLISLEIWGKVEIKDNVKLTYYDSDGKTSIGEETVKNGSSFQYNKDIQGKVNIPNGHAFRGWFYGTEDSAEKIQEGTTLTTDKYLYAKTSPIEQATDGSKYTYELTKQNFYLEDHELIAIANGSWHDKQHGWTFSNNGTITLQVAKNAHIDMSLCQYSAESDITVTDKNGRSWGKFSAKVEKDGTIQGFDYTGGEPTTLTIHLPNGSYVHSLSLSNYIPVNLTFDCSDKNIQGKGPDAILCDPITGKATMPGHLLLYREGWSFAGWTDGTHVYKSGEECVFQQSVTLTPKMVQNTISLAETNQAQVVTWPFDHRKAPAFSLDKSTTIMPYTQSVDIDGTPYDVSLLIDASKGKIVNTDDRINALNNGAEGAQINNNTLFTIPAVYGMKVTIHASDKVDEAPYNTKTYFGTDANAAKIEIRDGNGYIVPTENIEISEDQKTITFTYKGDARKATINIVKSGVNNSWGFFNDFTVTYPVLPSIQFVKTISNLDTDKFPKENAEDAGVVRAELKNNIDVSHGNTGSRYKVGDKVTISATPSYGYDITNFKVNNEDILAQTIEHTIVDDVNKIEVVYKRKELYQVTASAADKDAKFGTVYLSPKYPTFYYEKKVNTSEGQIKTMVEAWYTPGTEVIASGDALTDYMLDSWDDGDEQHTGHTYQFTMGEANRTLIAHFILGKAGNVTFKFPSSLRVNGEMEKADYMNAVSQELPKLENVRSFTIPTNYTIFKSINDDGTPFTNYYTLDYWADEKNTAQHYDLGKTYSFSDKDEINLVPVFKKNPATQTNRTNNPVIRYDFGRKIQTYYDTTSKEERNVCAQSVNIGKNQNVFWTSKVWTEVREDGKDYNHWRDVAMWCNTGSAGYIRNNEFEDWCAFGPGTTFYFASGAGTRISILSYSKITTTTIDGAVPTLDRERTNIERQKAGIPSLEQEEAGEKSFMYVYTHTTQSPELRPKIVIGDDYSYYQWFEMSTLAANKTTFHCEMNNEARGHIDDIVPTIAGHEKDELESGDLAFHKGERLKMTIHRKKGYELDQIVGLYKQDAEGNPLPLLKMNKDKTVDMIKYDFETYDHVKQNSDGSWGDENTMWILKAVDEKTYNAEDSIRTKYELEFTITSHRALQIQMREKDDTYYVTYNAGEYASGTSPEAEWVEIGDQFQIPRNQTLYYEGNTLDHWVDGDGKRYNIGVKYPATAKNLRMFPVFMPNTFNILNIEKTTTATWNFAKDDGAPTINYEGTEGILVTQLITQIGGQKKSIDLKINLNGMKGKFNNTSNRTERIQINAGSIIQFPSSPKCTATLVATETGKKINIAGKEVTIAQKNVDGATINVGEAECDGSLAYQDVNFIEGPYSKSFSVTYQPQSSNTQIETLTCNDITFTKEQIDQKIGADGTGVIVFQVSPWENADEKLPEITGMATGGGTVTATEATVLNPTSTVTVKTKSGIIVATYPVKFQFNTPSDGPTFEEMIVNGVTYTETSNEIYDVPATGIVKLKFNRTMQAVDITDGGIIHSGKAGRELEFKYWDMTPGSTITLQFTPEQGKFKDIYGKVCLQTLNLTLHIKKNEDLYQHNKFNFIVGKDGDINEAISAANGEATDKEYNNPKNGQRYYIFVPDGEYELKGNTTVSWGSNVAEKDTPVDEEGKHRPDMNNKNNGMTNITQPNVSIIGQSKEGVTIWNHPVIEGIAYTATLDINNPAKDFYAQDFTLENRFNYWGSLAAQGSAGAGRAAAFVDRANRTTLKNVAMWSWQDTYYSANGGADYRGYMENCDLAGVVDWICGSGDIWFEQCNLIVRDRSGNNLAAPHTEKENAFGYVFNECIIKAETDQPSKFQDKDWTLARPWSSYPGCTFINTKMYAQPRTYGWGKMTSGLKIRFHEYNSKDANGNPIPLETRSLAACSPAPGSDDCILSDISQYNLRNVVGGSDGYEPNVLCRQIDAASGLLSTQGVEANEPNGTQNRDTWEDNIELDDDVLLWNSPKKADALCYFLFKLDEKTGKWMYKENTTENSINLSNYGSGYYCVRAANQRGGLGVATETIHYVLTDPYELNLKQVGDLKDETGQPVGWSTICLPFNAKVPEGVNVFAATAHNKSTGEDKVDDYTMTLTPVDVINKEQGYVVYGPVGTYSFRATSRTCEKPTILLGNPESTPISSLNKSCYVLANKTWGVGFYKFSGTTLAANRAWLPQNMVTSIVQEGLSTSTRAIRFDISSDATGIHFPTLGVDAADGAVYNMQGQRVDDPSRPGIYIIKNKGKVVKK